MATVAIDLHGGDFGPSLLIPACFQFFREQPSHQGILVGDLKQFRSVVQHCPSNIDWLDKPALGDAAKRPARLLKRQANSSIESCFELVKQGQADVLVSAEHTGVLLVLTTKYGQVHPFLKRPALVSAIPTVKEPCLMLDLGASYTAKTAQLLAFSAIGTSLASAIKQKPSLALLNVGVEAFKGPIELQRAAEQLANWKDIDFKGYVEACDIYSGDYDIVICDGFSGNHVIKSAEGSMALSSQLLSDRLNQNYLNKFLGLWFKKQMKAALKPLDPANYNGAVVAGSDLAVVKSHGNARSKAFNSALVKALALCQQQSVVAIQQKLDQVANDQKGVITG
ncbi:phosphate acyltransferase [Reinekea thalattae]|uniref:Phosphate acyltransferase n=1 Tax=Reinekea thalattae TaxID=2593301 RepID=A0A5C8Z871_9GAMM|nr:hypothetical protein [Reinekea thalattae]TXR53519.1 hypothetical protein FME95_02825 [Reinekea thalattae]